MRDGTLGAAPRSPGTRAGLSRQRAIDVLWLLNSPAVFGHFVRRAGWSPDQYEHWLADTMVNELLDNPDRD